MRALSGLPALLLRIALGLAAACMAVQAPAQQRIVQIPEAAKRAEFTFRSTNEVVIDGRTAARMAPGVRIFGRDNMLLMWGSLSGTFMVRYTIEELSGLVQNIWILTDAEIARPDPRPAN